MRANVKPTQLKVLLYYAAKFIGLAPFAMRRKKFHSASLLGKTYAVFIAVLLAIWVSCFCYSQSYFMRKTTLHQIILISWGLVIAVVVISTVFTFAIKSEKIVSLMNKIIIFDDKIRDLPVTEVWSHEGIGDNWISKVIKSNGAVLILLTFEAICSPLEYTTIWKLLVSSGFVLFTFYAHNIILIFVKTLLYIEQYFKYLNKNLQTILIRSNRDVPLSFCDLPNRRIFVVETREMNGNKNMRDAINKPSNTQSTVERIKKIEILHDELTGLVQLTTRVFTIPIIFIIYQYFFKLILLFYHIWEYIHLQPDGLKNLNVTLPKFVRHTCRLIISIYDMVLIAHACASTCKAANTTRFELAAIWNVFRQAKFKDEFAMFAFHSIHKRLTILTFGFFDLGYPCLFQMLTAVTSYLLVFIQLQPPLRN